MPEWSVPRTDALARTGVGWTRNLSEGGACVELAEPLRPHMPLRDFPPLPSRRKGTGRPPDANREQS